MVSVISDDVDQESLEKILEFYSKNRERKPFFENIGALLRGIQLLFNDFKGRIKSSNKLKSRRKNQNIIN